MENNNETTEAFEGFFDSDVSDTDFFAIEDNPTEKKIEDQEKDPAEKETKKEEEQEEEDNLFETGNSQEEEEDEEEEEQKKVKNVLEGESISTLETLKKKGLLDYELEEGEELTESRAEEILEDSFEGMFEERLEELFESVPQTLKDLNKFVLKGGDLNEFLASISSQNSSGLTEGMDLEEEENQILALRHGLTEEGYDKEYIDAQLEFLKDSGRLKSHSEVHFKKWETKHKTEQALILKNREAAIENEKAQKRALKNKVIDFLNDVEEVSGFTVTKEDRKQLPNYMSDRNVKLDNGGQITEMQKDLMRVLNSPTGSVQIAKLLKSANENGELTFEAVVKKVESKVAQEVRNNVRQNKKVFISTNGEKSSKKRPLFSYFD